MHFIVRHLKKRYCNEEIKLIATNSEQYISVQFRGLRFIDSFQFLSTSLEKLVDNLKATGTGKFIHTRRHFGDNENIYAKGEFPYEYMVGRERFCETALPSKEAFYSRLTEQHISDDDYARARKMFETMGCRTLEDYHNLYLKLDTLLLCDVFEQFRVLATNIYGIDPPNFYTLPSMSWSACLKKTRVNLDLLTDPAMYLFFENNIRGGNTTDIFPDKSKPVSGCFTALQQQRSLAPMLGVGTTNKIAA